MGEAIPLKVLRLFAAQFGMCAEDLDGHAVPEEARLEGVPGNRARSFVEVN